MKYFVSFVERADKRDDKKTTSTRTKQKNERYIVYASTVLIIDRTCDSAACVPTATFPNLHCGHVVKNDVLRRSPDASGYQTSSVWRVAWP